MRQDRDTAGGGDGLRGSARLGTAPLPARRPVAPPPCPLSRYLHPGPGGKGGQGWGN